MRDRFAIGQYKKLDDAAKLSAPAFELLESGVELGAAGNPWVTGPAATRSVRYESIIVDTAYERFPRRYFEFWGELFVHFAAGGSVSRSVLSRANELKRQPFEEKVVVKDAGFVVAHQSDNTAFAAAPFGSHAEASAYLHAAIAADPTLTDSIHILPASEVSAFA
jgi:hypothetical protein